MANDPKHNQRTQGALGKFDVGGELSAVEKRAEREQRLKALPPDERELAEESARLADLYLYFATQKMDIPAETLAQIGALPGLPIAERVRVLKDINRRLLEYVNDVDQDSGIRQ